MKRTAAPAPPRKPRRLALPLRLWRSLHPAVRFPFALVLRLLTRTVQIILSVVVGILHPQFKWFVRLLLRSALVRNYITPALRALATRLYDPYFTFLRSLPPFWATVSIAVPLAVLEPAKAYATVLIASQPKAGIALWLFLQALSFVLIDKTWTAVRPQSRKIRLVSRLHAWGWLNYQYGKHWIVSSPAYRAMRGWVERAKAAGRAMLARLAVYLKRA